ncbi:MazG nucleotide pyrophosphohydrolase domain-containing protein [Lederbergia citrea]|uniref:NTP pyrophosphohydrolase MazG putative catalytic core domain-containing protein n=1 Tax=Lederbergia citrea TaxID=2833581 RepID=A0A942UQQ6_9BACI|nr:MazG nucleotide pyrophosphohydrolase domain-containing protein [Lederbergia citrea]MBS4204156.1 hypothetical protein [Lederbergia citrea]MBS4221259.1 hypothetical protein [Lederbergia citrea]
MQKIQEDYQSFVEEMGWDEYDLKDYQGNQVFLLYIHMLLTTEVAEVAEEFRTMFYETEKNIAEGYNELEAMELAKWSVRDNLGKELADCLAYLLKFANYFDYDLEKELYSKLDEMRSTRK